MKSGGEYLDRLIQIPHFPCFFLFACSLEQFLNTNRKSEHIVSANTQSATRYMSPRHMKRKPHHLWQSKLVMFDLA